MNDTRSMVLYAGAAAVAGYAAAYSAFDGKMGQFGAAAGAGLGLVVGELVSARTVCPTGRCPVAQTASASVGAAALAGLLASLGGAPRGSSVATALLVAGATALLVGIGEQVRNT
jgi:hypothetical protein